MSRTRIEVTELRQYANALHNKAEDVRSQTQSICKEFLDLVNSGAWNDSRSAKFIPGFDSGTISIANLADRCDSYAVWLERLANEVEDNYGETMDVS